MGARAESKGRRIILSVLIVGVVGALVGVGTLSAFSSSTMNSGNNFDAGTVYVSDNDAGSALYNVTDRKPGDTVTSCIKVTYGGSLAADVHLYTASTIGAVGQYVDLSIDKGTSTSSTFPNCGTFTSEANVYTGTLAGFATSHNGYANGSSYYPASQTKWNSGDTLVYRFTLTLQNDNNANGQGSGALISGAHSFTWEARNQ